MLVTLKRSEWQCYIDTPDGVIGTINGYFSRLLFDGTDPVEVQREMYKFCDMFKEWGFSDSECNEMVTQTINKRFKSNINRWAFLEGQLPSDTPMADAYGG